MKIKLEECPAYVENRKDGSVQHMENIQYRGDTDNDIIILVF
jgi:hypothetical protein